MRERLLKYLIAKLAEGIGDRAFVVTGKGVYDAHSVRFDYSLRTPENVCITAQVYGGQFDRRAS